MKKLLFAAMLFVSCSSDLCFYPPPDQTRQGGGGGWGPCIPPELRGDDIETDGGVPDADQRHD